jgi:hypothetical protein
MERTELREAFFAETRTDPWAHMTAHLYAHAWAEGYEQALRDNGLDEQRRRKSFGERVSDAYAHMTDRRREAEARLVIAMAGLGERLQGSSRPLR